jgi:hypothetical protein
VRAVDAWAVDALAAWIALLAMAELLLAQLIAIAEQTQPVRGSPALSSPMSIKAVG